MPPWPGQRTLTIATACLDAAGSPDLVLTAVELTHAEYADGVHCERIEDRLRTAGYDEPFLHFDEGPAARLLVAVAQRYAVLTAAVPAATVIP